MTYMYSLTECWANVYYIGCGAVNRTTPVVDPGLVCWLASLVTKADNG